MARNFFEEIKQVIRDKTDLPEGLVANLQGDIAEAPVVVDVPASQEWYALQAELSKFPTLREFVDAFTFERLPIATAQALGGRAVYPASGSLRSGVGLLLYTTVKSSGPRALPLSITAPGHNVGLYVDDVLQGQNVGSLDLTVNLSEGEHFIAIVCFGSQSAVAVTVPQNIPLVRSEPTPDAPILIGNPTAAYLAEQNGSFVVTTSWSNEAYASAWQVYRAEAVVVGAITSFVVIGEGRYKLRIAADVAAALTIGGGLYTTVSALGTVASVTTGATGGVTFTDIEFAPSVGISQTASDWIGKFLYRDGGNYLSLATVTYTQAPTISYRDASVQQGKIYLYRVTAFGFIEGVAESEFSEPGYVYVTDLSPPASVTFNAGTDLRIVNGEIQINFIAPNDPDYHGVKVCLEDASDPSTHTVIATAFGVPGEPDQISFRPPRGGKYWLRTLDWAENIQPVGSGVFYVYDGNSNWSRAINGVLLATVNDAAGTAALSLTLDGLAAMFPATVTFYRNGLESGNRIALSAGVFNHTIAAPGTISSVNYAALGAQPLPESGLVPFWAKITDKDGFVTYAIASADRGVEPDGSVVVDDYLAAPTFTLIYDEDVESIVITIPNGSGGVAGTKTFTRTSGLAASGGGVVFYTVGNLYERSGGGTAMETPLAVDATRDGYKVEYKHAAVVREKWRGKLHGVASAAPTLEVRYALDETTRDVADVFVRVGSPRNERVTLEMRDDDDPTLPVWAMVTAENESAIAYLTAGAESLATQWFKSSTGDWAQKFNNIPLKTGQTKFFNVRAIAEDSGIASSWQRVAMPLTEIPTVSGVDLTFDEATDRLRLTAVGATHCRSALFEISADPTFATGVTTARVSLVSAGEHTLNRAVVSADRNKIWYGRVTPFNGPLTNTPTPLNTGLAGVPVRDTQFIPLIGGSVPSGTVELTASMGGVFTLRVTPTNNALSFGYTVSTTETPDLNASRTVVNFAGGASVVNLGLESSGAVKSVAVWFYELPAAGGEVSPPTTRTHRFMSANGPQFDYIHQLRDGAITTEIRVNFLVRITDPTNAGGTLKVWNNKNGLSTPNPAAPPEYTMTIGATPVEVNYLNFPLGLAGILSNGAADKVIYLEFVNSFGHSTGKREVKVTRELRFVGPNGTLTQGVVDIDSLSDSMRTVIVRDFLPYPANEGDLLYLTSDGQMYRWRNGGWEMIVVGDHLGQIDGDSQIAVGSIKTHNIDAFQITTGLLAVGAVKADQIFANAIRTIHIDTGQVIANHIKIATLDEIVKDLGIITNATLRNLGGNRYLNLNANGAGPYPHFLYHEQFRLTHDGTAVFGGRVVVDAGQHNNNWKALEFLSANGTWAHLRVETDTFLASSSVVEWQVNSVQYGTTGRFTMVSGGVNEVFVDGMDLRIFNRKLIIGNKNPYPSLFQPGTGQFEVTYTPSGFFTQAYLNFEQGGTWRVRIRADGEITANNYLTYSPEPPKPHSAMTAQDWISWAYADANKPVWPHKKDGMPHADHPEVKKRAKDKKRNSQAELDNVQREYGKDIGKVAIGTAQWANAVMQAVAEAVDFEDFKRRLGM